jgi:hypothetical protein
VSSLLIVAHSEESNDDRKPVNIVGNDGAICCRVRPAEQGIEDAPSAATIDLRVAALTLSDNRSAKLERDSLTLTCHTLLRMS